MWEAIQYVASPFALVAFIAAIIATVLRARIRQRVDILQALPEEQRGEYLTKSFEVYRSKHNNLTRQQKYDLMIEVLQQRVARLKIIAIVSIAITAILAIAIVSSFFALQRATSPVQSIGMSGNAENVVQNSGNNSIINTGNINIRVGDFKADHIELIDLVAMFAIPDFASYNVLGWGVGSGKHSPIKWMFYGIRNAPKWAHEKGPYYREGRVIITINGKITHHILKKEPEPVAWRIILHGPRMGVTGVTIDTDVISQEMGRILYESKSLLAVAKKVKCEPKWAGDGLEIYEVHLPGRKPLWMEYSWSCGSAGCASEFYIMYSKNDAMDRKCTWD